MIYYIYKNKIIVDGVEDIPNNNDKWFNNIIEKNNGYPDIYYCGDDINGNFFKVDSIIIKKLPREKQQGFLNISATKIRELIREKNNLWKNFVPKENHKYLEKIIATIEIFR